MSSRDIRQSTPSCCPLVGRVVTGGSGASSADAAKLAQTKRIDASADSSLDVDQEQTSETLYACVSGAPPAFTGRIGNATAKERRWQFEVITVFLPDIKDERET